MAVTVALGGVVLISFCCSLDPERSNLNNEKATQQFMGVGLTLIATLMFSFAKVLIKYCGNKYFRKDRKIQDTLLFQTMMGVTTFFLWWPFFFLWDQLLYYPFFFFLFFVSFFFCMFVFFACVGLVFCFVLCVCVCVCVVF